MLLSSGLAYINPVPILVLCNYRRINNAELILFLDSKEMLEKFEEFCILLDPLEI